MKPNNNYIKNLIKLLGFTPQEGEKDTYYKLYSIHNNYIIKIDFDNDIIDYGEKIKKGDLTTSNFENSENFVVLECVNRVLEKGYPPERISLEHKWLMGRKEKGKLDILISDENDNAYLMIECKTWGEEYNKEKRKMQRDGGQLFSYYQQDKATLYLCLYASRLGNEKIEYVSDIIKVDEQWRNLNNQKEIFDHWNKNFKDNGIFDEWANAYDVQIKALTRGRLKELTEDDSGRIFNQFLEILRHNIVSDKPNAFNKILNLFICKIIDEDKNDYEEVDFQWFENDTNESLQMRLNDLYKEGMKRFLDIEVTDYSDEQLEDKLYNIDEPEIRKQIQAMFKDMRLQKNPEFAFKEVYNEKSFDDNAIVVREVVELLQPYQFRYGHKQQFLGDFFELLLNTSIKQESGQFFTPIPIAKFIVSCLPVKELILKNIEENNADILPSIIDYATGSGHFLTEWMDLVQGIIDGFEIEGLRPSVKKTMKSWQENPFQWAKDFVYGIEADYRLVKTAKVSSFLNGDGEAKIIRANGLDNFKYSTDFKGKLKEFNQENNKQNEKFDVIIANPPYSVNAFKNTLKYGEESFDLYERLTDESSEIECLFLERATQLLKEGGLAGIILPNSILINSGIYTDTREMLFKYFYIRGIVELGSNTFMATGTNTVILFLERRSNNDWKKIKQGIENFFEKPKEATINGIEKAFSKYVKEIYEGITLEDYITWLDKKPNKAIKSQELYKDYLKWFNNLTQIKQLKDKRAFKEKTKEEQQIELDKIYYEKVLALEKDRMLYFFLVYQQQTVLVKVGEKQEEKEFIGYEFSNRRGHEGIRIYRDESGKSATKLYDDENSLNPQKANFYIYQAFLGKQIFIEPSLSNNIAVFDTIELIEFKRLQFEKLISLGIKKKINFSSVWKTKNLISLGDVANIQKGTSITKRKTIKGNIPVIAGGQAPAYFHNQANRKENIITVSASGAYSGFINYWEQPIFASDCNTIVSKDESIISTKLIYLFLKSIQDIFYTLQRGQAQPHVYASDIEKIKIPLPPRHIQEEIIEEIDRVHQKKDYCLYELNLLSNKISSIIEGLNIYPKEKIDNFCELVSGQSPSSKFYNRVQDGLPFYQGKKDFGKIYLEQPTIWTSSSTKISIKNDILMSVRAPVGDVNINSFEEICIGRGLSAIRPLPEKMDFKLLFYYLKFNQHKIIGKKGLGFNSITRSEILSLEIPVPTIEMQQHIASEIEILENKIEQIETQLSTFDYEKEQILKKHLE